MIHRDFLLSLVKDPVPAGDGFSAYCPFHDDDTGNAQRSFSIFQHHEDLNVWLCKCHASGCVANHAMNVWQVSQDLGVPCPIPRPAPAPLPQRKPRDVAPLPSDEEIAAKTDNLFRTKDVMDKLSGIWQIGETTIRQFELGWDGSRLWIPIRDEDGKLKNVRQYAFDSSAKNPKLLNLRGRGHTRLHPASNLAKPFIILFEGEKDCIIANSIGLPALTATGGAGSWSMDFTPLFRGKDVAICYDIDIAGRSGAQKVKKHLVGVAKSVKIVTLPSDGMPDNGDFADWILRGGTADAFWRLIEETPVEGPSGRSRFDGEPAPLCLVDSHSADNYFQSVQLRGQVVGKDLSPYLFPREVHVACPGNLCPKKCPNCSIRTRGEEKGGIFYLTEKIEVRSDEVLRLMDCTTKQQQFALCDIFGFGCPLYSVESRRMQFVEEIWIIEDIPLPRIVKKCDGEAAIQDSIVSRVEPQPQRIFVIGGNDGKPIESNSTYLFDAGLVSEPTAQHAVHVSWHAQIADENVVLDAQLSPEILHNLKELFNMAVAQSGVKTT